MALLGNYSVILKNPATFIGGTQVSNVRNAFGGSGQNLQMYYPDYQESTLYPIGLSDTFNDNSINSAYWFTDDTSRVLETNGNIEITTNLAISYVGLYSLRRYNLTGSYASVKLEDAGNQALTSLEVYAIYLESDSNSANAILISGNTIYARRKTGGSWSTIGSSLAYVGATHQYFRIREYGGTVYYEYSTTGNPSEYTTIASTATTFQISSVLAGFFAGTYAAEASATTVIFDDFCTHSHNSVATWSLPTGTQPPYSYHLADIGGELSSTTLIKGASDLSITSLALGKALEAAMAGVGTVDTAGLSLVTSMIASLAGTGSLTGSMVGTIQMAADLAGSGNLTASLGMLSGMFANLSGSGLLSADLKGKLSMAATIYVNEGSATIEQIVNEVVQAIVDMGATGGLTVDEHAQLMKTLTVGKFIALK